MCGISAIISKTSKNVLDIILNSLCQLQNRGYDSAGIAFIQSNDVITYKKATTSKQDSLDYLKGVIHQHALDTTINTCIGHTR